MSENCSKVTISGRGGSPYYGASANDCEATCKPPHQDHDDCDHHHKCLTCEQQEYVLSDGIPIHLEPGKEVHKDIVLSHNPHKDCGTLSGVIKDKRGCPVENALVKIFDSNHHPVAHVFTNHEGQFLVCLAPGNYIVKAVR